jgi:predicted nucleic acid-binding protein
MVDEGPSEDEYVFVDTSLIVAATVEVHPNHATACENIDGAAAKGVAMCINGQVCREHLVVLTRQPVSGRLFDVAEALASLNVWMTGCTVLEETEGVLWELLDLVERFEVKGEQVHDCNIVATMRAHGIRRLATRNARDFERYGDLVRLDAVQ